DRPLLRVYVAGTLWMDSPEERASANLRSALWRLRRPRVVLVRATSTQLQLAPQVAVDIHSLASIAHDLINGQANASDSRLDPQFLSADLLPDWYDDWVHFDRERLRQLRLHALEALCRLFTQ